MISVKAPGAHFASHALSRMKLIGFVLQICKGMGTVQPFLKFLEEALLPPNKKGKADLDVIKYLASFGPYRYKSPGRPPGSRAARVDDNTADAMQMLLTDLIAYAEGLLNGSDGLLRIDEAVALRYSRSVVRILDYSKWPDPLWATEQIGSLVLRSMRAQNRARHQLRGLRPFILSFTGTIWLIYLWWYLARPALPEQGNDSMKKELRMLNERWETYWPRKFINDYPNPYDWPEEAHDFGEQAPRREARESHYPPMPDYPIVVAEPRVEYDYKIRAMSDWHLFANVMMFNFSPWAPYCHQNSFDYGELFPVDRNEPHAASLLRYLNADAILHPALSKFRDHMFPDLTDAGNPHPAERDIRSIRPTTPWRTTTFVANWCASEHRPFTPDHYFDIDGNNGLTDHSPLPRNPAQEGAWPKVKSLRAIRGADTFICLFMPACMEPRT